MMGSDDVWWRGSALIVATMAVLSITAAAASAQSVLEVGKPGAADDYLCWAAVPASLELGASAGADMAVTIASRPSLATGGTGSVVFSTDRNLAHATDKLNLTIGAGETSVPFFVAGKSASSEDDDVEIVVRNEAGDELATNKVMIRVRKNAETLTDAERDRFLSAFVTAGNRNNEFSKYWGLHSDAVRLAHQQAFLPWHRALLLEIEREIQAVDPSVALPYWAFDTPAPKLFSQDFIGTVGTGSNPSVVTYSTNNPLSSLHITPALLPLTRARNGDAQVSPDISKEFMRVRQEAVLRDEMWGAYHGSAHVFIGGIVGDISRSPADPLFFLLHANVDRGWAAWQRTYDRFNRDDEQAYFPQGAFDASLGLLSGNFEEDTMWPWDGVERPTDPVVVTVGRIRMPANPGPDDGIGPDAQVGEYLDYLDVAGDGGSHGFCYDDVPGGVGSVAAFPELPE